MPIAYLCLFWFGRDFPAPPYTLLQTDCAVPILHCILTFKYFPQKFLAPLCPLKLPTVPSYKNGPLRFTRTLALAKIAQIGTN